MENTKKLMPVKEWAKKMGLGLNKAYDMVNAKDFPAIRMGTKIYVVTDKVDEYINNNLGRRF